MEFQESLATTSPSVAPAICPSQRICLFLFNCRVLWVMFWEGLCLGSCIAETTQEMTSVTTRVCRLCTDFCSHSSFHPSLHFLVYGEVKRSPGGTDKRKWAAVSCWVLCSWLFLSVLHHWGEESKMVWWLAVLSLGPGQTKTQNSTFYPYALGEYAKPQFPSVYNEISFVGSLQGLIARSLQ